MYLSIISYSTNRKKWNSFLAQKFSKCAGRHTKLSKCNSNKQSQIRMKVPFIGIYILKKIGSSKNLWKLEWILRISRTFTSKWEKGDEKILDHLEEWQQRSIISFQLTSSYTQKCSFHTWPKRFGPKRLWSLGAFTLEPFDVKSVNIIPY
jgi:hypothetical protein